MNRFKKKTIALVFASVIAVAGSFALDNYKNTITGVDFGDLTANSVNVIVKTKNIYSEAITPLRKDAETYVLTLPEVNSEDFITDLTKSSGAIKSVTVRTMPYTNNSKGYTRITLKLANQNFALSASNEVYIPEIKKPELELKLDNSGDSIEKRTRKSSSSSSSSSNVAKSQKSYNTPKQQVDYSAKKVSTLKTKTDIQNSEEISTKKVNNVKNTNASTALENKPISNYAKPVEAKKSLDYFTVFMWIALIILLSAMFIQRAMRKMNELAGESFKIDVEDETTNETEKKVKKIKKIVDKYDATYSEKTQYSKSNKEPLVQKNILDNVRKENSEIIDLDEIFKEHIAQIKEEEENEALEDFLSGLSFVDIEEENLKNSNETIDENLYNEIINNNFLEFSADDLARINKLLGSEINDEVLNNIDKYLVSNPIEKVDPKNNLVENLVLDYAISRNIIFTSNDVSILQNLMDVELDKSFVEDLRVNPERTIQMEEEILLRGEKYKKPSEIIVLNANNLLPDLSEKIREQGNKRVESNKQPEIFYYEQGYDVETLTINAPLIDFSKIQEEESYVSKPSDNCDFLDESFQLGDGDLILSDDFADLLNVAKHAEKDFSPKEIKRQEVNEEELLNSIMNATLKSFYDDEIEEPVLDNVPTVRDIKNEMSQFEGFEITESDEDSFAYVEEAISDNDNKVENFEINFEKDVSLKKEDNNLEIATNVAKDEMVNDNKFISTERVQSEKNQSIKSNKENKAKPILEKINSINNRLESKNRINKINKTSQKEKKLDKDLNNETIKFIEDGKTYNVISSVNLQDNKGCYLTQNNDGYDVFGYIGEKITKIRHYEDLKTRNIYAKLSEQVNDTVAKYIIRIGLQKFIITVLEDKIEFLMDL